MKKNMEPVAMKDEDKDEGPDEYKVKDAAETLMKAHEIKNDEKLMPHVKAHLKMKKDHLHSIIGEDESDMGSGLDKMKKKIKNKQEAMTPKKRLGY